MKKLVALIIILAVSLLFTGIASATPKLVPKGTKVSAVVEGETAKVTISGITPIDVEFYSYEKVVHFGSVAEFTVNLREGRRFNFTFKGEDGKTYYALITPDMVPSEIDFVGPGIEMDCKNPDGCAFKIKKAK